MSDKYNPAAIEAESFRIITDEIRGMHRELPELYAPVIKRVIHTTADFSYLDTLYFSEGCMEAGRSALRAGVSIVTDTNMARAGINKRALGKYGGTVLCHMAEERFLPGLKKLRELVFPITIRMKKPWE